MTRADAKRIAIEVVKLMKKERLIEEQPERLLTLKEAAEMLKLTPKPFFFNHKEPLPYIKRGGRILYRQSDIMAYINR